jgi:hypothetical protein
MRRRLCAGLWRIGFAPELPERVAVAVSVRTGRADRGEAVRIIQATAN